MYKNKTSDGKNNICGQKIRAIRLNFPNKVSQKN